ncbi:MAG: hypothetical protein GXO75_14610 [Calditrichaeota bacterium]|nr:hypothetical protein [Calditrichota bacterium]
MGNKNNFVPLSELCQKLQRSETTIRRYVRDYREYLDVEPEEVEDNIPRYAATQLALIRDLKHTRLKHEDTGKVLHAIQNEHLRPKIIRSVRKAKKRY